MAKNRVISGDYSGATVSSTFGAPYIAQNITDVIYLDNNTVERYEVLDATSKKSAASVAGRGLLGGFLLGPVGALAGAITTKSKGTHVVAIQFKSGAKSLLEVDDKLYKNLIRALF